MKEERLAIALLKYAQNGRLWRSNVKSINVALRSVQNG